MILSEDSLAKTAKWHSSWHITESNLGESEIKGISPKAIPMFNSCAGELPVSSLFLSLMEILALPLIRT